MYCLVATDYIEVAGRKTEIMHEQIISKTFKTPLIYPLLLTSFLINFLYLLSEYFMP